MNADAEPPREDRLSLPRDDRNAPSREDRPAAQPVAEDDAFAARLRSLRPVACGLDEAALYYAAGLAAADPGSDLPPVAPATSAPPLRAWLSHTATALAAGLATWFLAAGTTAPLAPTNERRPAAPIAEVVPPPRVTLEESAPNALPTWLELRRVGPTELSRLDDSPPGKAAADALPESPVRNDLRSLRDLLDGPRT